MCSKRCKAGFCTLLFSLASIVYMTALFAVGITQSGVKQTTCGAAGNNCTVIDCNSGFVTLARPFKTSVTLNGETFPDLLFCGWAPSNTAFRSTVCWLVIVAGMAVIAGYRCDSSRTLFWCRNAFLVATVAMISVLTLDSNSVRVGASYCADSLPLPAGMSKKCNSLSLIGLCAADGGAAIVLWITYEVVKATHKVLRDRPARRGTQLPPEAELTTP